jgi:hypothetical protein
MIRKFLSHVLPGVIRPLHILWNQIIGFLFICLALGTVPSLIRHWRAFDGEAASIVRLGLTLMFAIMMGGYGIFSFVRARKISRT